MGNEEKREYRLENLSCANCAMKFEKNVSTLAGVSGAQVNFGASKLSVVGDATIEELEAAGAFDGIKIVPAGTRPDPKKAPLIPKREAAVSLVSLVFLAAGVTASYTIGDARPVTVLLYALSILIGGAGIFKTGLSNLVRLDFDIKTLMTIAVIGAAIIGEWREAAVVVFLFAVSEALEAYSMDKARQSIRGLMDLAPPVAEILRDGKPVEVPTDEIRIGDLMLVRPGGKIAMDGTVSEGRSSVSEAAITGESIPAAKAEGDEVFAGTLNGEGALKVRVTKRSEDTTIAKIIHLVEEAQAEKAPSQKFVDRFARWYTPAIMLVALLVAVVPPLLGGDWHTWIYQGLAVLVVGCPCALVISTPVAIVTAIGNAARNGVLIKGGVHLEELGRVRAVAFDKTGTLTNGVPAVTDVLASEGTDPDWLLGRAAAVESLSQHPLASAITARAKQSVSDVPEVGEFHSVTGKGAEGLVGGERISIGSLSWIESIADVPGGARAEADRLLGEGKTVMAVAADGRYAGLIAAADAERAEAAGIIRKLKDAGVNRVAMLTGDHQKTAEAIAGRIGITDVRAALMPDEKLGAIKEFRDSHGSAAMVGDGINDAPALAAASVGIAMGGAGTDAALETADIALMADDLEKLPYTIRLSRKTLRIIKENIMFALGLKIAALLLLIPGWLTLWIAIFADMGATLIVVLNSLRLIKIRE
ncbi:heavy metal translocating P-type ATPase [Edaphobacillus lindanitolerans]|uniref:Cd(2+)-exporting ATPase n=1 Tax=Edaphobacillus lindanitolerans TaxID=550447 RepID=A0A1U7PRX9_9BACI|nr:heavy metal translocating P-type ATPase [Edaphobacillus lindanitolerans]SIT89377.1 Cd2+/Zn2+-exporting ATPase [Edaphobacillus lindanitolerans]